MSTETPESQVPAIWMISLLGGPAAANSDPVAVGLRPGDWSPPPRLLDPEFGEPGASYAVCVVDELSRTATYRIVPAPSPGWLSRVLGRMFGKDHT
jgi:hypothetical protein